MDYCPFMSTGGVDGWVGVYCSFWAAIPFSFNDIALLLLYKMIQTALGRWMLPRWIHERSTSSPGRFSLASQWYNKRLVSSTTLCYKDSKTTWREVCKFIKEESRFLEPSVFWNFALIWTKLNPPNTSLHQSKPEISPADFSNLQIVRTNFLFPRWFEK